MSLKNKATWFHGSPFFLKKLRKGSSITQNEKLAQAFSTKPTIVSVSDDGSIRHNGKEKGQVYKIIDTVTSNDIHQHPATMMNEEWEWITKRDFNLQFLYEYTSTADDFITEEEIRALKR